MQRKTDKFALQWQISAHFSYYTIKHIVEDSKTFE